MTKGFIAICRHRIGVDGNGVTTLAAFHGCPLRCRYCLNKRALSADGDSHRYSPQLLFNELKKDDLYFVASGGGVTFGGGEPLLNPDFIISFRQICTHRWKINVETSLNVPTLNVAALADDVDHWIVDIKDTNPEIYRAYTGCDNRLVMENLRMLLERGARVTVRVPLIPGFNTDEDVSRSITILKEMGVNDIDQFTYIIRN